MKCPVCKKTIPENVVKCPHCKSRIGLICKKCGTINSVFNTVCKKCGEEILRICPKCGGANLPKAEKCRKCGAILELNKAKAADKIKEIRTNYKKNVNKEINKKNNSKEKNAKLNNMNYENMFSQQEAKALLLKGILSRDKKIISLTGKNGIGKSVVLKSVMFSTKNKPLSWLVGECTPISQLTCGGFIQNILLSLFNLPDICANNMPFQKNAYNFLKKKFQRMSDIEIFDLINFLYPHFEGRLEDIFENKAKTFALLEKIFDTVITDSQYVLVIDNFEYIDSFSYEFILKYFKRQDVWVHMKLLLLYTEPRPVSGYFFYQERQAENCYLDLILAPFEYSQMLEVIENKKKTYKDFPKFTSTETHEIYRLSKGNPAFFEQILALKTDCLGCNQPFEISETFSGVIGQRLSLLSYMRPDVYNFLVCAATLGSKINIGIIKEIFELSVDKLAEILKYLVNNDYIIPHSELYYEFKSILLWETVLDRAKLDEGFIRINEKIFNYLGNFILNSIAIMGVIAQNLKQPHLAFEIWAKNVRYTSYIGDVSLYVISQKQSLAIINEFDDVTTLKIRYNIAERLGKLLTSSNPHDAMEFLPDAINNAKNTNNEPKEIELLGYLASCCTKTGNYCGEIECSDAVLSKVQENMSDLDKALLKCTKLKALLKIGNSGQIINMVDNEILPVFEEFFKKKQDKKAQRVAFVFEAWVKTYLILAQALVFQGNNRAFEVLAILFEIIENNKIEDELFICKCKLTLAFANTMKGNFRFSNKLLEDEMQVYQKNSMDNEAVIMWNFIDIINKFMTKKYNGIREDLFQIVTFADNNGDNFTKNILKVLLGKYLQDNDQAKKAMEIYNEQIVYFAKEKMAFGALLTWFLIADVSLKLQGSESAVEIATEALEVAKNPKIYNPYFTVLLRMVLAKAYIVTSDFDSVKMNLDTAVKIAKNYDMKDLLSRLYLMYGKYFQEIGLVRSPQQQKYMIASSKMYLASLALTKETGNMSVHTDIRNAQKVLNSFCKMNSIKIED